MKNEREKMEYICSVNENFHRDLSVNEVVENKENVTLICLHENVGNSQYLVEILDKYHELNDYILLYTISQLCLDYIKGVINEKIILIVSKDFFTTEFENDVHSLDIIDSIFIYPGNDNPCDTHMNFSSKTIHFFNDQNSLLESIKKRINLISKQIKFNPFDKNYFNSIRYLKLKPASFVWFHIIIDILKKLPKTHEAKQQMIDLCRSYYRKNSRQLNKIQEFEEKYQSSDAIRWYTEDNFLHRLLNKALRTEDIFLLYSFRYYIIDLCQQIEDESRKYLSSLSKNEIIQLYRGQIISKEELKMFRNSIGNFISPNGFFSTSENRQVALWFTDDGPTDGVLFEIEIDPSVLKQTSILIAASIKHISNFPEEKEVLFGIGTTFEIQNVIYDDNIKKTCIQLILTDKDFQYIEQYIQLKRKELEESDATTLFGELIIDIGLYSNAELYFKSIIKTIPKDHKNLASLYHGLGYVYYKQGLYDQALTYGIIAHDILKRTLQPYNIDIAQSSINLGWDYKKNGDVDLALKFFKEALHISHMNHSIKDHHITAMTLISIGDTYTDLGHYQNAFHYLKKGYKMFRRIYPNPHTEIANTLIRFGNLFEKQSLFARAIRCYRLGYKIAQLTMPIEHPRLLEYFENILNIYNKINNNDEFIQFSNTNITFRCQLLGDAHPHIAELYIIIGDLTRDTKAKIFKYNQALNILGKCSPYNQEAISTCQKKINAITCLSS